VAVPETAGVAGATLIGARYSAGLGGKLRRASRDRIVREGMAAWGRVGGRWNESSCWVMAERTWTGLDRSNVG